MAAAEVWRDEITLLWAPRDTVHSDPQHIRNYGG